MNATLTRRVCDGLSDEALERFVASFPVEILGAGSAA